MKVSTLRNILKDLPEEAEVRIFEIPNCTREIKDIYLGEREAVTLTNMPPLKDRDVQPADLEPLDSPHAHELINHKED